MSATRELLFDWLFNASVLIGLFAVAAAAISSITVKAKAKHQHCLYLAVLALCLAAPVLNTFWQTHASVVLLKQPILGTKHSGDHFWVLNGNFRVHAAIIPLPTVKTVVLGIWQVLFMYQLIHFTRSIYRVRRLRRGALLISSGEMKTAGSTVELPHYIVLLESTAIDDPVTVGLLHPAIILPSKVLSILDQQDLTAILAHEYGHIRRRDFLVHLVCQLATLPMAWHPGMQYLMSKISQTRELACDDYAAVRLGKRLVYARTLVRLASLCLQVPRSSAMGLGIFNGDNLEDRIIMLTEKKTSLSRAGLFGLALIITFVFGSSAVLARAVSLQEASAPTQAAQMFAGTWHWMIHGRSFATMILVQDGSAITGTVTESKIALDENGELSRADPTDNGAPSPISKTKMDGNALHVTVGDESQPFEFLVTLKDATHAEIHPVGAPPNMKPIQAERAN